MAARIADRYGMLCYDWLLLLRIVGSMAELCARCFGELPPYGGCQGVVLIWISGGWSSAKLQGWERL